eukprot:g6151.t1
MGNTSSGEDGSGLASPNILSKVTVKGSKADMDAFLTEGRVNNVHIGYVTKKQHERFNPRNVNRKVQLTHAKLKGVKRNWAMISEGPETQSAQNGVVTPLVVLYDTFFARVFLLEPSMRSMFEDNMVRQSKFLVGLVNLLVKMEDHLKEGLTPIYSFADRSVAMGARPEHFEVIVEVLPLALEACAGEGMWTSSVAGAWRDVLSFAMLAVVERTVESWGNSHGSSLSELWHTLEKWRASTKDRIGVFSTGSTAPLATPERLSKSGSHKAVTPFSTASSMGSSLASNGSGRPPEAPPPLGYSDDGDHHYHHKKGLGSLSLRRKGSNAGGASTPSSSAKGASMDLDPGFLSEAEADVLSSNYNSPAGCVSFGSGSSGRNRGGGPRSNGNLYPGDDRLSPPGSHLQSHGSSNGDGGASFSQSMDSIRLGDHEHVSPGTAVLSSSAGGSVGVNPLRGLRPVGDHGPAQSGGSFGSDSRQWASSSGRRTGTAGGSDGGSASSSSVSVTGQNSRASGVSRSSLKNNLLRRKKITRSASLEDDDRRRSMELTGGGGGGRGRGGSRHGSELSGGGAAGMLRGRGRDGNMALSAGYVRSQSVSDEILPMDHHHPGFDAGRKGKTLVSRMRRTASSVIRHPFRSTHSTSSTSPNYGSGSGGGHRSGSAGNGVAGHGHNASYGGDGGARGEDYIGGGGGGGGGSGRHGSGRSRGASTDMGSGGGGGSLRISSASPGSVSTAVPTPSVATPASDADVGERGRMSSNSNSNSNSNSGSRIPGGDSAGTSSRKSADDSFYFSNQDKEREARHRAVQQQQQHQQHGQGGGPDPAGRAGENGDGVGEGGLEEGLRENPWKQMKLHELMAKLEDSTAEETEANFTNIGEAILAHLKPSEVATTRALALDVAQTFVQNVLSERSKDRKSSKIRRRAFKELLAHLIPLMLDCLKSPGGDESAAAAANTSSSAVEENGGEGAGGAGLGSGAGGVDGEEGGLKGLSGEVVVLHYYQQHHQYLLKVAVLETMNRFLTVLRALFRPPQSTRVQKVVAPLLDASEDVLREKAAAVLGKLSLCGRDTLKWANIAIKVSLESHNLLQDAWPDETAGQIPSAEVESIMGDHPLLPPIQDTFNKGDAEAHVLAIGRRFPALCKLLATLVTASLPKAQHADADHQHQHEEDKDKDEDKGKDQSNGASSRTSSQSRPFQIPFLVSLAISLVQRVLRMGEQAWAMLEEERASVQRDDRSPQRKRADEARKAKAESENGTSTLSPELAARVSGLLLPSAVTLLEALVASSRLEKAMESQQGAVCQCMGQAVAQMPVQGGVRFAAYRSMAVIIRYIKPDRASVSLGVPILPLLFNEALLALGNRVSLHPLNTTRERDASLQDGKGKDNSPPQLVFNARTPLNNGHGVKLHEDTVWAGVECLAVFILDCGLFLPAAQVAEVERVVTEGVELLAHRPLEVSPFNDDEPQVLRHASTREAFVRLVHYYLLLAEEKKRNPGSTLYSEARLAFQCHLQDPDGAVARECSVALMALKTDRLAPDSNASNKAVDKALEDMEAEADNNMHAGNGEAGYTLEELENGEYHVVRRGSRPKSPTK